MDTEAPSAVAASNGETASSGTIEASAKLKARTKGEDEENCIEAVEDAKLKDASVANGCPKGGDVPGSKDSASAINGTVDHGSDKLTCDVELRTAAAAPKDKLDGEVRECGDSQQDSLPDGDAEKTEPSSEPSEDLPLKSKETNSEDSTPSSTPRRSGKKKSKKVSKLSIMHAIAQRLSGQPKPEVKVETEPSTGDNTPESSDAKLSEDTKEPEDSKPESPARGEGSVVSKKSHTCAVCSATKGLRYQVLYQGKTQFLCSDVCFKAFRSKQKLAPKKSKDRDQPPEEREKCAMCQKELKEGSQGLYPPFGGCKPLCSQECLEKHHEMHDPKRTCAQCKQTVDSRCGPFLVWETMEFCGEDCLRKYQNVLGSHCAHCAVGVNQLSLGKYCVRFGADIRQFCSGKCLEEFKRGLKVCCLCQKDLSKQVEGFLAPVGDKGHFKDFCSQQCLERYERMNTFNAGNQVAHKCSSCGKEASTKYEVEFNEVSRRLCSELCVAAFRYSNKIKSSVCENCHKLFDSKEPKDFVLYHNSTCQLFCSKGCINLFVLSHRKIVPCSWCKVKKYNFDMIERVEPPSTSQLFCSLNCLSLYRVNQNASSSRVIRCDNCFKMQPAQYHLTMSDASIRNFCCYKCVITFQNQFTNLPILTTSSPTVNTATIGKSQPAGSLPATPVISNIRSLAPIPGQGSPVIPTSMQQAEPSNVATAVRAPAGPQITKTASSMVPLPPSTNNLPEGVTITTKPLVTSTVTMSTVQTVPPSKGAPVVETTQREVIVQLPFPKLLRNKSLQCRPAMLTKGISCRPLPCHKEMQTDESFSDACAPRGLIPIPVPIYVPAPLHMYSHAVPSPLPIPIPIPIPIFIPTTKDTTEQILEALKQIKDQMQSDDKFDEALLTVAELLTGTPRSKRSSSSEGESSRPKREKRSFQEEIEYQEEQRKRARISEEEDDSSSTDEDAKSTVADLKISVEATTASEGDVPAVADLKVAVEPTTVSEGTVSPAEHPTTTTEEATATADDSSGSLQDSMEVSEDPAATVGDLKDTGPEENLTLEDL